MRIVYVLTSLGMGGAERQVVALAKRMAARGHAVCILVLRAQVAEQWATDLTIFHLGMRRNPASFVTAMARGRRFLVEFRPDLVNSHSFHGNLAARLLKAGMPALRVVSTVHNVYEGGWGRMLAYRLTDRLARITTAVSHAAADRFVELKAVSQEKCAVVPNGIDLGEFHPSTERREQTRAAMDVEGEFIWLAAGRIAPAKDYPNLLRAFQRILASRSSAQLWVAGEGETEESSRVRSLASELGMDQAVRWLGLRRDMPALLDAADGFVLGSAWEGMPLAVGEAMAMENPVVCTDVGGVRELAGEAGTLAPPKNPEALAEAMLDLMRWPPEDRLTLGRAARARILRDFNMDARADDWETIYLKCIRD